MSAPDLALFVSAVEGHVVTRYGTAPFGTQSYIGVTRDAEDPSKLTWNEGLIVALPRAEADRFRREYAEAIREGALRERTAEDFAAQLAAEEAPAAPPTRDAAPDSATEEK